LGFGLCDLPGDGVYVVLRILLETVARQSFAA
jgi:hypothetical protein